MQKSTIMKKIRQLNPEDLRKDKYHYGYYFGSTNSFYCKKRGWNKLYRDLFKLNLSHLLHPFSAYSRHFVDLSKI